MIESTNMAKTLSCMCHHAIGMDYFESLVEKKKLERDVITTIEEEVAGDYGPCESSDLYIQFPNREDVTSSILNLPYIVRGMYTCTHLISLLLNSVDKKLKIFIFNF